MLLLLSMAEAVAAVVKVPLSVLVLAMLLSSCLHAVYARDEEARTACPLVNIVREHTTIVVMPVTRVNPQPVPAIRLSSYTHTTSITFTSTTCLLRDRSMPTFSVEVVKTSVVTTHETLTVAQVTAVLLPVTHTTAAHTTITATRIHHTTNSLIPQPPPDYAITSGLVLARTFTTMHPLMSVETMLETKTDRIVVTPKVTAVVSTRTVTDTITFTVCPPELFIK